jgi:hemoglobin
MASIYDEIGGSAAVAATVDEPYDRILADPRLSHYFERIDMRRQKRHMRAFVAAALGGLDIYAGRDMGAAHAHLRVTGEPFDRVAGHLVGALKGLGVPPHHVQDIVARIAPLRSEIVMPEPLAA